MYSDCGNANNSVSVFTDEDHHLVELNYCCLRAAWERKAGKMIQLNIKPDEITFTGLF